MSVCGFCGPYRPKFGDSTNRCPKCGLDPGEVNATKEVIEYGFEEAYRREARRRALRSD